MIGVALLLPVTAFGAKPVTVSKPWFRYIIPQVPAGGYMTVRNHSSRPTVLTGASSPSCDMLMLHRSTADTMMAVRSVTIPAGGRLSFSPGGYHLMCMQPKMRPGERVPVTLTFQNAGKVRTMFPVFSASEQRDVR
jgi:copper(I)-binding protein